MPEHLRITIFGGKRFHDLSCLADPVLFNQGIPPICAVCQTNRIGFPLAFPRGMSCCRVKEQKRVLRQSQKPAIIPNGTAGEHQTVLIRLQNISKILPVQKIGSSCMSPGHAVPVNSSRIMLIIQFINSIVVNQSVGIIHPAV